MTGVLPSGMGQTVAGGLAGVDNESLSATEVALLHRNSDVDGGTHSQHHTLGAGPNQAAAGNHTHDGGSSVVLDGVLLGYSVTGSKTTGDLAWRNSVTAALVKLGATDATT